MLWQTLVLIPMVANFSSTKIQLTNLVSSQATANPKAIIDAYTEGGNPSLDKNYTVFGQVIDGMDIVDAISKVDTDSNDKPTSDITITKIDIIKDYKFK